MAEGFDGEEINFKPLQQAIEKDFGLTVTDIRNVEQGLSNKVYEASLDGKEVFIRMDQGKNIFPVETKVYKDLSQQGIPVPQLIAYNENPVNLGYPTMVVSKVPGKPIYLAELSAEKENDIYFEAGVVLASIHSNTVGGFGTLVLEDGKLEGKSKNWREVWDNHFFIPREIEYLSPNKLITPEQRDSLEKSLGQIKSVDLASASLLHADYHGDHIFTDGGEITGVIDFGSVLAGDPRYDVAISLFFFKPQFHQPFREGYGELAADPIIDEYFPLIAAYKAGWRHRKGKFEGAAKALKVLQNCL